MKIISENLSQQSISKIKILNVLKALLFIGYGGCHALLDERNVCLHKFYLYLGFTDIANIDQNDHMILLAKRF
ncbi:unnamed protein product [Rotaria sp. Silwood2]|nr:unnamed protein product [Rotaria sp. Silwood2]CAF4367553.1 unnamed protein product [Rotaria sp. Silwood2]